MSDNTYNISRDSIVCIIDGETYTVRSGTLNFTEARTAALEERWEDFLELCSVGKGIQRWTDDQFTYEAESGTLLYEGNTLPPELMSRIISMAEKGDDPTRLMKFWKFLTLNTSHRSMQSLYRFLENNGIPIDKDGFVLAYKGINRNYTDRWTGTLDNSPGSIIEMDRNKVSDDPRVACAEGLHLGSEEYAKNWAGSSGRVVICRVNPKDVVCVPYDHGAQKMRSCRYEVLGNYGGKLDDLAYDEDDIDDTDEWYDIDDTDEWYDIDDTDEWVDTEEEEEDDNEGVDLDAPVKLQPWDNFDDLNEIELYSQNLDHLRKYARHYLNIIGASKIPGGKVALIDRILDVRRTDNDE